MNSTGEERTVGPQDEAQDNGGVPAPAAGSGTVIPPDSVPPRTEALHEGKAKVVYGTTDPELVRIYFKDDATAFDGRKRGVIADKGRLNAQISARLFQVVERAGVPTHFRALVGERELLARAVEIIPIEVVVRNVVAGSLARRLGLEEGRPLAEPVIEFYYKRDDLGDPLINHSHVRLLGLASDEEMGRLEAMARRVNEALRAFLAERGLLLVDFKLEFGRAGGRLWLADEISPDTCRLWDRATGERLDKDRFRQGLGGERAAYSEVWRRLQGDDLQAVEEAGDEAGGRAGGAEANATAARENGAPSVTREGQP